jgi:hypothetical protein
LALESCKPSNGLRQLAHLGEYLFASAGDLPRVIKAESDFCASCHGTGEPQPAHGRPSGSPAGSLVIALTNSRTAAGVARAGRCGCSAASFNPLPFNCSAVGVPSSSRSAQ